MRSTEKLAQLIIESADPEIRLQYIHNQSSSVHDFDVERSGQVVGALEVTLATDQQAEEMDAAVRDERKGGFFIARQLCQFDWWVHPDTGSNIKKIRKNVDRLLRGVEQAGIGSFTVLDIHHEPVAKICKELRIEAAQKVKWKRPAIGISGPSSGGRTSPEEVWCAAESEMQKADNLKKLQSSGAKERHLFVLIGHHQGAAWSSMMVCEPPSGKAKLPEEVTHLWISVAVEGQAWVWIATAAGWTSSEIVLPVPAI